MHPTRPFGAKTVDRDKAVQVLAGLMAHTLDPRCRRVIDMDHCFYGN